MTSASSPPRSGTSAANHGYRTLLAAWSLGVAACAPTETAPALHIFDGATMGTTYAVRVVTADTWDQTRRHRIGGLIQAALDDVESKMSHYEPSSELSRFNQTRATAPFPVSRETFDVVRHAYELSELTGGALDVTVGPLVNAWGFGPVEPDSLPPDAALLAQLRDHMGYWKLELDPVASTLRKTDPELECDLSAVAKGYGVDRVGEVLLEEGVTRFMVEVGGEIVAVGLNQQGGPWRIAIERPTMEGGAQRVVLLSSHAMATSGDYWNVREVEGRLFSHTIDPRTGWPVAHQLASVSVIAELCVVADGLATALQVLGPDDGYALAVERGWAALFLVRDATGAISEAMTPAFEALLDAVTLVPVGRLLETESPALPFPPEEGRAEGHGLLGKTRLEWMSDGAVSAYPRRHGDHGGGRHARRPVFARLLWRPGAHRAGR